MSLEGDDEFTGKLRLPLQPEVTEAVTVLDGEGNLAVDRNATALRVTFGRRLHCLLANLTTQSASLTVRQNY